MIKNGKITNGKRSSVSVAGRTVSVKPAKSKSSASSVLTQHSTKAGRFADGVRVIGERDHAGLVKLADR